MGYTPFFVGPYTVGLEKDLDSYLIPETAFPVLDNAYLWRGRVYKKGGTQLLGRLGVREDTLGTRGAGADTYNTNLAYTPIEPGTIVITDGVTTFTDDGEGGFVVTPVAGNGTVNAPTNYATGAINITFNVGNLGATVTANYTLTPTQFSPVMGLCTRDIPNTPTENLIAFDRTAAYSFSNTLGKFQHTKFYKQQAGQTTQNVVSWSGTDTQFFDAMNYQGAFFATNGNAGAHAYNITAISNAAAAQITIGANNLQVGDVVYINNVQGMTQINNLTGVVTIAGNPITVNINSGAFSAYTSGGILWLNTVSKNNAGDGIRWYDGTGWVNFMPPLDDNTVGNPRLLKGALLLMAYKGYMLALNTQEGTLNGTTTNYQNRVRFSQYTAIDGSIFFAPPMPVSNPGSAQQGAWWDTDAGFGGFIDAPTQQSIIAAEFVKDVLIVYFERSIYRLVATGNDIDPFIWEKINTEIGAESTFSPIPFDDKVLSVGQNGIYECNGVATDRIDRIIPDQVFSFQNRNGGALRVHGIRDFYSEMVYWTFIDSENPQRYPNRSLIYNYLTKSFSVFKNSFTTYGYYNVFDDLTWGTATNPWSFYTRPWDSPRNSLDFPVVIAGNQQGFVVFVESAAGPQFGTNAPALVIQGISAANPSVFTSINHNLSVGDFVYVTGTQGTVLLNDKIYQVNSTPTADTFTLIDSEGDFVTTSTYTYGGLIRVIDNFDITTKNLNPFFAQGRSMRLGYVDLYVSNVDFDPNEPLPEVTIDLYLDDDRYTPIQTQIMNPVDTLYPNNDKFWVRVYFDGQGEFLSLKFRYSDNIATIADIAQGIDPGQMWSLVNTVPQFVLHGMILWMKPTGRMLNV